MLKDLARRVRPAVPALLLAVLAVALYACAVTDGHLQLDDWGYTAGCPFVASGLTPANVARAFRDFGYGGIWMPLTYASYMADVSLFGGGWPVHHATNVALHALNAALVYLFLLAVLRRLWPRGANLPLACFLAALVWTVHPARAEAVAWIASRKEELWTAFALLASLAWMRFLDRRTAGGYALAFAAFALALLAKPTAVCIPVALFALECLLQTSNPPNFKTRHSSTPPPLHSSTSPLLHLLAYAPMLLVSAVVGLIAVHSQVHPTGMDDVDVFGTSFPWRLANAAVALGMYCWHAPVPFGIHIDYRAVPNGLPLDAALGLCVLTAVLIAFGLCLFLAKGTARRLLVFAAALFAIAILPVLGIVGFTGDKAYADRYTYLPSVALLLPVAAALAAAATSWGGRKTAAAALVAALALAAAALPVIRSFRDDASAYGRVLAHDPSHWRALRIVGNLRCTRPDGMDGGIEMLKRSIALRPSQKTANALAYVLAIRGKPGDFAQVGALGRAVAAKPALDREGLMLDALGIVAMREGKDAEAVRLFLAAAHAPERSHASLHTLLNLGLSLANCGRAREALAVLQRVRAARAGNPSKRAADAIAAIQTGRTDRFTWSAE